MAKSWSEYMRTEGFREYYEYERQENQQKDIERTACVRTRVPSKWRLIDLETGEVYGFREQDGSGLDWIKKYDISYEILSAPNKSQSQ